MKKIINTKNAPAPIGPYNQAILKGNMLYTSGQIALTAQGEMCENDIKKQTRQIFANIKAILEEAQSGMEDIIKINIFLTSMKDFGIVNVIMAEVFGDHKPVRSTIEVSALPKNAMIEMDVIAVALDYH